ncbi:MAG: hypothetical protein A2V72_01105 [Candidatus Nealsonbacteria bacterium RBG_13_37_56]|uniref:Methyltransferase type 11 domain-containing protein n=1 Tax=Candidatus Nealsonbacteria bacterium RBG_13_37_56 TaxID=1801661 RepID=A0A1G2DXQ5_9BACT|nr:MAG: hypothetical protein A2V72_01105 [Candidatus Nealsonbacteria bacterium RBG_13_37_56]
MTKYWHPKKIKEELNESPGRKYLNEFLYQNLSKFIPLGEIKMLDIGCGSGYIREIFSDLGYKLFYTGVDVERHQEFNQYNKYSSESNFIESKIEDFNSDKKYDLIFSICALEHIKDDFLAVSKGKEFLKEQGLQIHIVPTLWSFPLYLWHGHRRYRLVRLRKMFKEKDLEIYRVGGLFSFFLHFSFITVPIVVFKNYKLFNSKLYRRALRISNKLDKFVPFLSPFYIVIVKK